MLTHTIRRLTVNHRSRRLQYGRFNLSPFLAGALPCLLLVSCAQAQSPTAASGKDDDVLAIVDGTRLTRLMVLESASKDLENLELQRLEFEAKQREQRYVTLRRSLDELIAKHVLTSEAKARGLSVADLLEAEVDSRVSAPTEEEIDGLWEVNKNRLRGRTKEQMRGELVNFLRDRGNQVRRDEYLLELRGKYAVEDLLEPLRYDVPSGGHPTQGPSDAPVSLVEFSDFECPYCSRMNETLREVTEQYGDKVKRVFRQFPLNSIHPNAQRAAEASLCAADQKKFWEMHGRLFESPRRLDLESILAKANEIGLDQESFKACLDSGRKADRVRDDRHAGVELGVSGTPALFINGRPLSGAASVEEIGRLVDEELQRTDK